jgi:hypothetical protein
MALYLDLAVGDSLKIGPDTTIKMEAKSGQRARVRIDSKADVRHLKAGEAEPTLKRGPEPPTPAEKAVPMLQRPKLAYG